MKSHRCSWVVLGAVLGAPMQTGAQAPVGALAIDERRGDRYGWAVDYESAEQAAEAALAECGSGCAVVLRFERCAAYATDRDDATTEYGWGESPATADVARQQALAQCRSRGGSTCVVRASGCSGPVVEQSLALDRATRRRNPGRAPGPRLRPGGARTGCRRPGGRGRESGRWQSGTGRAANGLSERVTGADALVVGRRVTACPTWFGAPPRPRPASRPLRRRAGHPGTAVVGTAGPRRVWVRRTHGSATGVRVSDCDACPEMGCCPGAGWRWGPVPTGDGGGVRTGLGGDAAGEAESGCYTQQATPQTRAPATRPLRIMAQSGFPADKPPSRGVRELA